MPDSQAGHYCGFELRNLFAADDDQGNSSDQRQATENWWNRNMLLIFPGGVDRPDVQNLFLPGVVESLIRESQPTKNYQENSDPDDWFHIDCPAAKPSVSVLESFVSSQMTHAKRFEASCLST